MSNEVQSTSSNNEWTMSVLKALDDGSIADYGDMHWRLSDANTVPDVSAVYMRVGEPMTSSVSPGDEWIEDAFVVDVQGFMKQPDLFRMVRVYCHTGITIYGKTESPMALFRRYECCEFYNLKCSRDLLQRVITERLDIHSALQLFDVLSVREFSDNSLTVDVTAYVKHHISEASRSSLGVLSTCALPHLCSLLCEDDVNISESKLLNLLYSLCIILKPRGGSATQWFTQVMACGVSPWQCVRVMGLSVSDVVAFRTSWPNAFSDTFWMTLVDCITKGNVDEAHVSALGLSPTSSLLEPRKLTAASCYPRNIPMNMHGITSDAVGPASFVHMMWQEREVSVAYACVAYMRGRRVQLPPFACNGSAIQLTAVFEGTHVNILGGVDINSSQVHEKTQTTSEGKIITVYTVHFRHGRWNKGSAHFLGGKCFSIERLITLNALEGEGYKFDPTRYPVFSTGNYIMLKIVISATNALEQIRQ
jgi:hypothetical protein